MTRLLVLAMTIVAGVAALALAIPLAVNAAHDVRDDFISDLEVRTLSTASLLSSQDHNQWGATIAQASADSGARVVIVDGSHTLIADSAQSATERSFDRPEIDQALAGRLDSDVRRSTTLGTDLRFVAAPVIQGQQIVAAVRYSLPETIVTERVRTTVLWLVAFILAVIIAAGLLAWLLARSIAAPLNRLSQVARGLPEDLALRADEQAGPAEVRSVAAALNSTADRLIGLLRRQQRVAADASHHLRTPLTGVRMRLEAIEETADQPEVRRSAAAATEEVDRLTRRIDQVLALARTDAGASTLEPVDVSSLARERIAAAQPMAQDRGVEIAPQIATGLRVSSTPGTVARVIDELLGNALAYARRQVRVSVVAAGGAVVLQVDDDGPGVPHQEREAIFERFNRGSGAIPGGSGLGLALVRESVRASGGEAQAQVSDLGGLRVTTTWPASAGVLA